VDVVGAPRQCASFDPLLALIGDAVAVGVGEPPDARRARDINGAGVPEAALREHYFVGEHDRLVEAAVAIGVFEAADAVGGIEDLFVGFFVRAGGIGDIKPALVIEAGADGSFDEGRTGDEFDIEAVWDGEGLAGKSEFSRDGEGGEEGDRDGDADGDRLHGEVIARIVQDGQQENILNLNGGL